MPKSHYYLACISCHKTVTDPKVTSVCPSCGSALDVVYDYTYIKDHLNVYLLQNAAPRVIKYLDFYPLADRVNIVTLNEGGTPLVKAKNLGKNLDLPELYIKNEGLNPTGAFKDRGSFLEINKARELGYTATTVASTGNMAASVAAFSAQANLPCYVFVPDTTPRGKLAQCLSYGAHVIQVKGTYAQATVLAQEAAKKYGFYLAGDYAYRLEGQKSLAFEVAEQLFFQTPDWVIVPIGMGTNISAIWKGFKEYYALGFINTLPKIIGVQAEGCQPVVTAFQKGEKIVPVNKPDTVSTAIACGDPIDAPKALVALAESKGRAIAVSDDETLRAQQELAHSEAMYVEPASATTIAALKKLIERRTIKRGDRVVCVATGMGLKDPAVTLQVLAEPPLVEPVIEEVDRVIKGNLFSVRSSGMVDKNKLIFRSMPSDDLLIKTLAMEFSLDSANVDLGLIKNEIKEFREKGKQIRKADLQAIVETALQAKAKKKYLEVVDFRIHDTKHGRANAWVKIRLNGVEREEEANGAGPVDAAINALRKLLKSNGHFAFELMDYNVEVTSAGTDAATIVTMVIEDDSDNQVVARQTSPDIILASIEAFERGYNELITRRKKK